MLNGIVSGKDVTKSEIDAGVQADFGLSTHEGGSSLVPEVRSPHFTAGDRVSAFAKVQVAATGDEFDALRSGSEADFIWSEDLEVNQGGLYLIKTQEGNYAKIWVTSGTATSPLSGGHTDADTNEYIEFEYDYNPNGLILF
jgi:hypothetical protein